MSGFISEDQVERVRTANDIVEVIGEYIPLKKAGKDYKALCPFHREKTPSFQVSRSKQIFKCFGCGKGGNVFTFVMGQERVEFPEAVELLARRAGIVLERRSGEKTGRPEKREDLYELNLWAAKVYHRYLVNEEHGRKGRKYLEGRGFTREAMERFHLGYAPDNWEFLTGLAKNKYRPEDLVRAGLALRREGGPGLYDRFRDRVMFPILDVRGKVIAFGGRAFGDVQPKYLNSPETPLFEKSHCLYGLNWAKEAIQESRQALVVEGYTDVLTLMLKGVEGVVATLGTALGEEHVRQLRRYADEVVLVFDGDAAGEAAAERALEVFLAQDMSVKVALIPGQEDPAEFVEGHGPEEFRKLVQGAEDAFTVKMRLLERRHDLGTVAGKSAVVDEVLRVVSVADNRVRQDILLNQNPLLKRLTVQMGITESALRERLARMRKRVVTPTVKREGGLDARGQAERQVVGAMLADGSLAASGLAALKGHEFSDVILGRITQALGEVAAKRQEFTLSHVLDRLSEADLVETAVNLEREMGEPRKPADLLEGGLRLLGVRRQRAELSEKAAELAARPRGDEDREVQLLREYQERLKKRQAKRAEGS